ncbi:MAG: DNA repair protein RecN [Alphaproteobacteria bacterium]|nr:DNA repair protein RecN [Alphaproteobacteria bacterium]
MLVTLAIRDLLLIEEVELALGPGLCVLTGETGAGKSMILEALSFATGARADRSLVRAGADAASVTAVFAPEPGHPAFALMEARGLAPAEDIVLRRTIGEDGRSRGFINDNPVSVGLLREIGALLVELHTQFETQEFLQPVAHRALLDAFAGLERERGAVEAAHGRLVAARAALAAAEAEAARLSQDEAALREGALELAALNPGENEEVQLSERRALLMAAERISEDLNAAGEALSGASGLEARLGQALRRLERARAMAPELLGPPIDALGRALSEITESRALVEGAAAALADDRGALASVDDRLHALRDAARKFRVPVAELAALAAWMTDKVRGMDQGTEMLGRLSAEAADARGAYRAAAQTLSAGRRRAGDRLEAALKKELKPLKLDKAQFRVSIESDEAGPEAPHGIDRVVFEVATNPGAPFGPLHRTASGGELARFVLALKVCLAKGRAPASLVFDEIDQGVSGAVADAIGERLARLAKAGQVVLVTHSPQIAARADLHLRIAKTHRAQTSRFSVEALSPEGRREEVARMLSGAEITTEARAAAARLMSPL